MSSRSKNFIQRWIERLRGGRPVAGSEASTFERVMLRMTQMTEEVELTCDEVLALLDQFAEVTLRGEQAARLLPLVQRHLDGCNDCMEEYQALMRILRATPAA